MEICRLNFNGQLVCDPKPDTNVARSLAQPEPGLDVRVLRTLDECRAYRDDWARLIQLEGEGVSGFDVSATFEWAEALWQGFLESAPQIVLVAFDSSGVRGMLPCSITIETIARIPHRKLALITSIYDLRTGFLVGGDAGVLNRLLAFLFDELDGWDAFGFKVVEQSPSDLALRAVVLHRGLKLHHERRWESPYIRLPQDPDKVFDGFNRNMRSNLRRRDKQLGALGKLEMRVYDTEAAVPVFLDLMLSVEARSWKQDAGTALTASQKQQKLYGLVTPALALNQRFLGAALLLDDRPLAYIYGYPYAGVFVGEKSSYDEQFKPYGPGSLLRARLLEELVKRGIGIYDLAGDADPNKAHWTDLSYSRSSYLLFNRTLRAQLLRMGLGIRKWWVALREVKSGA
jgi:CelD/BcsL family acetyltransferase involved in cellulose biosynthesis